MGVLCFATEKKICCVVQGMSIILAFCLCLLQGLYPGSFISLEWANLKRKGGGEANCLQRGVKNKIKI